MATRLLSNYLLKVRHRRTLRIGTSVLVAVISLGSFVTIPLYYLAGRRLESAQESLMERQRHENAPPS